MKKSLLSIVFAVLAAAGVAAAQPVSEPVAPTPSGQSYANWDFLAFSFTADYPSSAALTPVYGVKVGIPISGGPAPVYGVDAAIFCAGSENLTGVQASLISTDSKEVTGLQFSLVNFSVKVAGLQLGIVNFAEDESMQIGLLNFIKNSLVPCLPIFNCRF